MGPEVIATPTGEFVRYEDYARLKAEVERLTKAGDAIVKDNLDCNTNYDHIKEWRKAAKEGKTK
jgi:hypothetical protein